MCKMTTIIDVKTDTYNVDKTYKQAAKDAAAKYELIFREKAKDVIIKERRKHILTFDIKSNKFEYTWFFTANIN